MSWSLFDTPVYYISFEKNIKLESRLKELGFNSINHFQAIDGRKFDIEKLLIKGVIGQTAYYDLKCGRTDSIGIPSLGAVGCTMSHASLWQLCVDKSLPRLIIVEEDVHFKRNITDLDIEKIKSALLKPNSVWINTEKRNISFTCGDSVYPGTYFYVVSNGACKELMKRAWPMQLQTDIYMSLLNKLGFINVSAHKIADYYKHTSTIQTGFLPGLLTRTDGGFTGIVTAVSLLVTALIVAVIALGIKAGKHNK